MAMSLLTRCMFTLFALATLSTCSGASTSSSSKLFNSNSKSNNEAAVSQDDMKIAQAISLLKSIGVPSENLCLGSANELYAPLLQECPGEDEPSWQDDKMFYIAHAVCALVCVLTAALAAGLTMGLLSLDPLMLLIKMRAGATKKEQDQAASLLPIVRQHHLLLVTLLLLNSMANEALPLFLEVLVSPVVAVILSVTLVLFFGEIIPSAVFTGPNKIELAAKMTPLVRLVMFLLWPIAFPIAKVLDKVLHEEEGEDSSGAFNRGELSALVRIQYEERLAQKQLRKKEKAALRQNNPAHVGGLEFPPAANATIQAEIRATTRESLRHQQSFSSMTSDASAALAARPNSLTHAQAHSASIHVDEVSMVEGALQMKTKVAIDVFTPLHSMFCLPHDTVLNEHTVVNIYSSGYSRVPVYQVNPEKPKSKIAICGILMTKHLIVVNPKEDRPLQTLPLYTPMCISPKMNLVDLLNLFQTGKVGHMALVCARPQVAKDALQQQEPLPEAAGLMGVITIEDVIEALLQEQIYDESDKIELEMRRIARWASRKWKAYAAKKKRDRLEVEQGMIQEETPLLGTGESSSSENKSGLFRFLW
jgi:metal transporter CNNM